MRATNYHRKEGQSGRAITHGTKAIIEDYKRLNTLDTALNKHLLFSFIPTYEDSYHHLKRQLITISRDTGLREIDAKTPDIKIKLRDIEGAFLVVYLLSF